MPYTGPTLTIHPSTPLNSQQAITRSLPRNPSWTRQFCEACQELSLYNPPKSGQTLIAKPCPDATASQLKSFEPLHPQLNRRRKVVRFASPLCSACHFLKSQSPSRVASHNQEPEPKSPVQILRYPPENIYILLANLVYDPLALHVSQAAVQLRDIRLLYGPLRIQGDIAVRNLAYEKMVSVRYSRDLWETWMDSSASYVGKYAGVCDFKKFRFEIPVSMASRSSCGAVLCVEFEVEGIELWDNNDGKSYDVAVLQSLK